MAATALNFSHDQSNDGKTLILTDTSDWDTPSIVDVVGAVLNIYYNDFDGRNPEASHYTINVSSYFGAGQTQDDLVFNITKDLLGGSSGEQLDDGIYVITYNVDSLTPKVKTVLVSGVVRALVYDDMRSISNKYMCKDNRDFEYYKDVIDKLVNFGFYNGMTRNAYMAKQDELLANLNTLQDIYEV